MFLFTLFSLSGPRSKPKPQAVCSRESSPKRSDPVGIRTRDPQLRRLLLYPAELPDPERPPVEAGGAASAGRGINTIRAPIRTQKACPLRQIRAQNYCFFLNYARKNVFLCVFFTKYCQKAALSPVCGRLLRDD